MQITNRYKDAYLREAKGHVERMNSGLLKLEKNPSKTSLISVIIRSAHTLKSISALMNYNKIVTLCHAIEDVVVALRKKKLKLNRCTDTLFESFDTLDLSLKNISQEKEELDTGMLVRRLNNLASYPETALGAGESRLSSKVPTNVGTKGEVTEEPSLAELPEKITSIEVKVERLDLLMNLAEELIINKMRLDGIKETLKDPELSAAVDSLGRIVNDMQYNIMQSRTLPLSFIFNRFPRMVRDLAKQERKEINLEIEGADTELDRSIVEDLIEPLVHIIRNSVDHGIEIPQERIKKRKPPCGKIILRAKRQRGYATIEIEDDGMGIDWDSVKNKAIKLGIIPVKPTATEIIYSIFSGVSTTKEVSTISGRGYGLNIVKKKIDSLGGNIKVGSTQGGGTRFTIDIPLTLAVFKALFVIVGGKPYAIPLANVERLVVVNKGDIKGMINYEAVVLDTEDVPITRLSELFNTPFLEIDKQPIVVIKKEEEEKLGLAVDGFGDTKEIVLKPLRLVTENRYIAGCTIIGTGETVLILDVANLILSKRRVITV